MPKPDMRRGYNLHQPKDPLDTFFAREKKDLGLDRTRSQKRAARAERNKADIDRLKEELERSKQNEQTQDEATEDDATNSSSKTP
jgi:monoamine oxidase